MTGCTPNWTCKIEAAGDARAHLRLENLHTLDFEPHSPAVRDNAEKRGGYWGQMQAFVKAVRKGEAGSPTLRDACQAICDSIERRVAVDVER